MPIGARALSGTAEEFAIGDGTLPSVRRLLAVTKAEVPGEVLAFRIRDSAPAVDREGAFLAVYDAEFDRMLRIAFVTTGSNAIAEDIVQDAFVELFRRWDVVREPAAYVRRAVVNRGVSWHRRRKVEREHVATLPAREAVWLDGDTLAVNEALARLSKRQRAAVALRYLEGASEAEIAATLGCRPGTVKSLLARARAILWGALDHDD